MTFTVFVDNQVVSHFFTKQNVSHREVRWLKILSNFNISSLCLKPGRLNVLGDALSRIPEAKLNNVEVIGVFNEELSKLFGGMENDQAFGAVYKSFDNM